MYRNKIEINMQNNNKNSNIHSKKIMGIKKDLKE